MAPNDEMLIDRIPAVSPRPVPMKVLAFGMSRTGTMCSYFLAMVVESSIDTESSSNVTRPSEAGLQILPHD